MLDVDLEVILEVLPHAGKVLHDVGIERPQLVGVPDAGELEQLGGVERPAAQDDLSGPDLAAVPRRSHLDADGAVALEEDLRHERPAAGPPDSRRPITGCR